MNAAAAAAVPAADAPPRASVCICTYNGGHRLTAVLDALAAQTADPAGWEVLVVDNASKDDTAVLAARLLSERFGKRGRVVGEPSPGLSFARRRAASEAAGGIVCFLDDDNLAEPDFVANALRAFEQHPKAGSLGGKVVAEWETEPSALARAVAGYALAVVDLGEEPFAYDWIAHGPVGAGLCIRRELLRDFCADPAFCAAVAGRTGASLTSGEDMALAVRVAQAGWERRYEPGLRLRHQLPAGRMRKDYLLRLYEGIGRGQAAVRRLWAQRGDTRATSLLIALKDLALWLRGTLLGPARSPRLTPVPVLATDAGLRRDLFDVEQTLLRGRVAEALGFAFRRPDGGGR